MIPDTDVWSLIHTRPRIFLIAAVNIFATVATSQADRLSDEMRPPVKHLGQRQGQFAIFADVRVAQHSDYLTRYPNKKERLGRCAWAG